MTDVTQTTATRTTPWASFSHRPSLDGLRAVAALLVVLFHAGAPGFDNGFAGVDVFFVLSGFLITSLLVREMWSRGRLDFAAFYSRRARRLLPAALLVLLVTAVLYARVAPPLDVLDNRTSFVWAALYVSNWYFISQSNDYFAEDASPSPVLHYWSLSVEEQFYIVWPVLALLLLLRLRGRPGRALALMGGLAAVGAVVAGVVAAGDPSGSYFATTTRAYQLLLGGTIAVFVLSRELRETDGGPPARPKTWRPVAAITAFLGLTALVLVSTNLGASLSAYGVGVVSCLATAALILGFEYAVPGAGLPRLMSSRIPVLLGRYSYSIYLWHWPVIVLAGVAGILPETWWIRVPLVVLVTIGLAAATWWLVESRALSVSLALPAVRRRVILAGAVGAVAVAVAAPVILRVPDSVVALAAQVRETATEEGVAGEANVVIGDAPAAYPDAPRVLVVGDSHANMLMPALRKLSAERGFQLASVTEIGCTWAGLTMTDSKGGRSDCTATLLDPALAVAADYRPDLTLLVSGSILNRPLLVDGERVEQGTERWTETVHAASTVALDDLAQASGRIVAIEPMPRTRESIAECLAAGGSGSSCTQPVEVQAGGAELLDIWGPLLAADSGALVSLDDLLCPDDECPAVVDGIATRRDRHHITNDYSALIAEQLDEALRRQGVDLASATLTKSS